MGIVDRIEAPQDCDRACSLCKRRLGSGSCHSCFVMSVIICSWPRTNAYSLTEYGYASIYQKVVSMQAHIVRSLETIQWSHCSTLSSHVTYSRPCGFTARQKTSSQFSKPHSILVLTSLPSLMPSHLSLKAATSSPIHR